MWDIYKVFEIFETLFLQSIGRIIVWDRNTKFLKVKLKLSAFKKPFLDVIQEEFILSGYHTLESYNFMKYD